MAGTIALTRSPVRLLPDPRRVITKPFTPGEFTPAAGQATVRAVVARVMALTEAEVSAALAATRARFETRHPDLDKLLEGSFEAAAPAVDDRTALSVTRRRLIGAYLLHEYSFEAAALTNPSMVPALDQSGVGPGSVRFVMSLRAIGEGHRSSIEFRIGTVDAGGGIALDEPGTRPIIGEASDGAVVFPPGRAISERILFPIRPDERLGLEDARFVRFVRDDGSTTYYATYTAFDGTSICPRLLETPDFAGFRVHGLRGDVARNKGLALFPRRVAGRYLGLSRHDDQSSYLVTSPDLLTWGEPRHLAGPRRPWELIKTGNCGSPIETEAGWLVITHGVGPLREYALGALLLDLKDPGRVIGTLDAPLLTAAEDERDGYVPNVAYSCGSLVHGDLLVIPYGSSDLATGIATVPLADLIARLI